MTTQTTKVKNGAITLPRELQKAWENAEVYISGEQDRISIKRLSSPSLSTMLDELSEAGKNITPKEANSALGSIRKGKKS